MASNNDPNGYDTDWLDSQSQPASGPQDKWVPDDPFSTQQSKKTPGLYRGPDGQLHNPDGSVIPDSGVWRGDGADKRLTPDPTTKNYNPFDRTQFRDAWMGSGSSYGGDVSKFLTDQNLDPSQFSQVSGTNGAWRLPTGEVMDLVIDKGGANRAAWTGAGHMDTAGGPIRQYPSDGSSPLAAGAGGSGSSGGGNSSSSSSFSSSTSGSNDPMRQTLIDMLMKRAQQGLNVDPNDPVIKSQTDANSATQNRQMRQYLSNLAEQKGPYGSLGAETRSANETVGQNVSGFQAELMGREVTAKRQEIAEALSSMQGLLTSEQEMSLRMQLAQMDDALQRLGLAQRSEQFGADLGYRYANLGSQNDQFAANYGMTAAQQAWYQDRINRGLPVS